MDVLKKNMPSSVTMECIYFLIHMYSFKIIVNEHSFFPYYTIFILMYYKNVLLILIIVYII